MIAGLQIAMLFMGFYALIKGKTYSTVAAKYVVQGRPARCAGIICLLPIPLSLLAGMAIVYLGIVPAKELAGPSFVWVRIAIEGSILALCLFAFAIISHVYRSPVNGSPAKSIQT